MYSVPSCEHVGIIEIPVQNKTGFYYDAPTDTYQYELEIHSHVATQKFPSETEEEIEEMLVGWAKASISHKLKDI